MTVGIRIVSLGDGKKKRGGALGRLHDWSEKVRESNLTPRTVA